MPALASGWTSRFLAGIAGLLASALPGLASDDRAWDAASETKARKLYLLKCVKCHVAYEPKAYTAETWSAWMQKMYARTKLDADQSELLDEFERRLRQAGGTVKGKGKVKIKPGKVEPRSVP